MKTKTKRNRRGGASGFTLIELLLVLVILGVLAAVVAPKFVGRGEQARETAAKADIATLGTALDAYEVDNGQYPSTEDGLAALMTAPSNAKNWRGPYLKKDPKDPWGNAYVYRRPGQNNPDYDLFSVGPDGREGNDDISNWEEKK